jgi:hypothetical protein
MMKLKSLKFLCWILWAFFVFGVENIHADPISKKNDIQLAIRVSPNISLPEDFENNIKNIVAPQMQQCLKEAFGASGFARNIQLSRLEWLSYEENNGISKDPENIPDKIGSQISNGKKGNSTSTFEIIVSEQVTVTHVPFLWNQTILDFFKSEEMRRLKQLGAQYEQIASHSPNDPRLESILKEGLALQEKMPAFQKTNRIYINANTFLQNIKNAPDKSRSTPVILAHELMHAWGNLDDEYAIDKSNNLMTDFDCILREDQIQQALDFRENH